jgi:methionyl-tRNA formyltransferase
MLKTAFIGNRNEFDKMICEWLAQRTDLVLIIWTNRLSWSAGGADRRQRVVERFRRRARRYGWPRALNEALYYAIYRGFLAKKDQRDVTGAIRAVETHPMKPLSEIEQIMPSSIKDKNLEEALRRSEVDALFAMCIDVFLPSEIIGAPRLGSFLWHEGITPEYRGVYSPFWAMVNDDAEHVGYTLLRMNDKLDAGAIYVQGQIRDVDAYRHWHSYLGHKSIIDSLQETEIFLKKLEHGEAKPIERPGAQDHYYSYATATALCRLFWHRLRRRVRASVARRQPSHRTR